MEWTGPLFQRSAKHLLGFLTPVVAGLGRSERRVAAARYVQGLLMPGQRKSVEPMAARLGVEAQDLQQFVSASPWSDQAVWKAIEGHLPPRPPDNPPLGCHRLRISDRDCFDGILARLVTGCSWDVAARLRTPSGATLRGRRTEWLAAGVFDKLVEEAIAGY